MINSSSRLKFPAFVFFLISISLAGTAQRTLQQRTDSISVLAKQFLNEKDIDKLYELTAPSFRNAIKKETFKEATEKSLYPLGALNALTFERAVSGVLLYKGDFAATSMTLGIGLEASDKIGTFFFRE